MFSGVAVLIQLTFFVNMAVSDVLGEILLTRSHKLGESLKNKKRRSRDGGVCGDRNLVCLFACLLVCLSGWIVWHWSWRRCGRCCSREGVGGTGTGVGEGVGGVVVGKVLEVLALELEEVWEVL